MGKKRHPSSCKSPMKYLAREEQSLSDGVQEGVYRDEETGKLNLNEIGSTAAKGLVGGITGKSLLASAIGGPAALIAGATIGMAKDLRQAKMGRIYNEGFEEADVAAMDDLSDMQYS